MKSQDYNDEYYMRKAIETAKQTNVEVPIGCCLVLENKEIFLSNNKQIEFNNSLMHAEMIVLNEAIAATKSKYLENATLYVTCEPCLMCLGAMMLCRVSRVVYGLSEEKFGAIDTCLGLYQSNHTIAVTKGVLEEEIKQLMKDFFKNIRKK